MVTCIKCNTKFKQLKKEYAGYILLLTSIVLMMLTGISVLSVIYFIGFWFVGIRWIITKPSSKFICNECKTDTNRYWKPGI